MDVICKEGGLDASGNGVCNYTDSNDMVSV